MIQLRLSNDRTGVDMHVLATSFALSREALDDALSLGTISYWYELGPGDAATPRTVFRSTETGRRVMLDRVGRVMATEDDDTADQPLPCSETCWPDVTRADATSPPDRNQARGQAQQHTYTRRLDDLLDEALRESFPASDPVAISFDAPRLGP